MNCSNALSAFNQRQFSHWNGLPKDCTPASVLGFIGEDIPDGAPPQHFRGQEEQAISFYTLPFSGYSQPVRLWFRENEALSLTVLFPGLTEFNPLLEQLGEPDAKLDYYNDVKLMEGKLFLYAARGIALYLNSDQSGLIELEVFRPMEVVEYKIQLYRTEAPREFNK